MSKDFPRRIKKISSRNNKAAEGEHSSPGGLHFGDYRPRYQETFNIYEKAKNHAREQRKQKGEWKMTVRPGVEFDSAINDETKE